MVKKYDSEFPEKFYKKFIDFCEITDDEFRAIIDSWRSDHIWGYSKETGWHLRKPIWSQNF